MASHKGIDIDDDLVGLLRHMDELDATRESLQSLQGVWDTLALLGQLGGNGVEIDAVRGGFAELTTRLVNQLGHEARDKAARALRATAQVAIDILVRNLFERTADIGFLATDDDLRRFAGATAAEREPLRAALAERLRAYQCKYTVYDDIVLLAPDGTLLARLDTTVAGERSADPLVAEALHGDTAFVERYRHTDLRPGSAPALVYASRMTAPAATARASAGRPVGVLCLCFDFADECRRIFDGLSGGADDWRVVALLDASGRVLASSDAQQLPPGARLDPLPHGEARLLRFAGRRWLATSCDASPYQGYAGPGWRGHVMVPLEHAFGTDAAASAGGAGSADGALIESLRDSPRLFSPALRAIPQAAERIELALTRTVWNGNVALGAGHAGGRAGAKAATDVLAGTLASHGADAAGAGRAAGGTPPGSRDAAFAKTLLREVSRTGARTRQVFTEAIGQLNRTVLSTLLVDQAACATLAVDILDRNRYERANDCRWWALTGAFRDALHGAVPPDAACTATLTRILQTIHGLYTVYANLLLFDRHGRIVAVSRADAAGSAAAVGQPLHGEWVRRTLAIGDPQGYVVSDFEASPLYGGLPTWVYAAAVRAPGAAGGTAANVGGLAIVFDAAPQLDAMLADTLPVDAAGQPKAGCFNAFVDGDGRVLASSRPQPAVGDTLPLPAFGAAGGAPARGAAPAFGAPSPSSAPQGQATIVRFDGGVYAVGACRANGYREFAGASGTVQPARAGVTALSFLLLAGADELAPAAALPSSARRPASATAPAATSAGDDPLDLATFSIGGQWYGLPGHEVEEALEVPHVLPLPGMQSHVRGSVMRNGEAVAVLDLGSRLGQRAPDARPGAGPRHAASPRQVVIVRPHRLRPRFGVLVEALGDNPEVARSRLDDARSVCGPFGAGDSALVEHLVKPPRGGAPGQDILMLLSADRLGALLAA